MPLFNFRCPACKSLVEEFCNFSERHEQTCPDCHSPVEYVFVPTRVSFVVYGNDTKYSPIFTGPRQKARYLAQNDLIELGDTPKETVHKEAARAREDVRAAEEARLAKIVDDGLAELGDAGLYTSVPEHVARREARVASEGGDS